MRKVLKRGVGIFLLAMGLAAALSSAKPLQAEALTIGFPSWPADLNWLRDSHPAAEFIRRAVTDALVHRTAQSVGDKGYELALTDSLRLDNAGRLLALRLKKNISFHDGELLQGEDVVFSLKLCADAGRLPNVASVSSEFKAPAAGITEQWVRVEAGAGPQLEPVLALADCPVMEAKSSAVFGADLGYGANLVSLGAYELGTFAAGRSYTLVARPNPGRVVQSGGFVLRAFKEPDQGLTALRAGTIDAFFANQEEVIQKAKKDETLGVVPCSIYMILHRKGFLVSCDPVLNPAGFRYVN